MKQKNIFAQNAVAQTMARKCQAPNTGIKSGMVGASKSPAPPRNSRGTSPNRASAAKNSRGIHNSDPDIAINSGAWLFNIDDAPEWFQNIVFEGCRSPSRSRHASVSPTRRPHGSDPHTSETANYWREYFDTGVSSQQRQKSRQARDEATAPKTMQAASAVGGSIPALNNVKRVFQKAKEANQQQSLRQPPQQQLQVQQKRLLLQSQQRPATSGRVPSASLHLQSSRDSGDSSELASGAWLWDIHQAPAWFQQLVRQDFQECSSARRPVGNQTTTVQRAENQFSQQSRKRQVECRNESARSGTACRAENLGPAKQDFAAISSGAWLWDLSQSPAWFQQLLKTNLQIRQPQQQQRQQQQVLTQQRNSIVVCREQRNCATPYDFAQIGTGAWLWDLHQSPAWFRDAVSGSVKQLSSAHVAQERKTPTGAAFQRAATAKSCARDSIYDPVASGAWLFDIECAPAWFRELVRSGSGRSCSSKRAGASSYSDQRQAAPSAPAKQQQQQQPRQQYYSQCANGAQVFPMQCTRPQTSHGQSGHHSQAPDVTAVQQQRSQGQRASNTASAANVAQRAQTQQPRERTAQLAQSLISQSSQKAAKCNESQESQALYRKIRKEPAQSCVSTRIDYKRTEILPVTAAKACFANDDNDFEEVDWRFFGEMRPNKTYLNRSKESKSGAQEKFRRPYY